MRCVAIAQGDMRCSHGAAHRREGMWMCLTHARLHDELSELLGDDLATRRIREGRGALDGIDLSEVSRVHSVGLALGAAFASGVVESVEVVA